MTDTLLDSETLQPHRADATRTEARVTVLTVLAHPDPTRVGERATLPLLEHARGRVPVSRSEPLFGVGRGAPLTCPFVSRKPLWFENEAGRLQLDVRETTMLVEVEGVPATGVVELDASQLERGLVLQLGGHVVLLLHRERVALGEPPSNGLIGASDAALDLGRAIARASPAHAVLVRGETGSGKELVARALHAASDRANGPFVSLNMAAIPASLAASELFGHARGAFSGADRAHDGFFRRAHGGTLFLDEVADTPMDVQAALLRVLETGEVQSVGGRALDVVDVRVVAATDGDLEAAIAAGRFRGPLLYRLGSATIHVPPLRERRPDIGRLARHFIAERLAALGREALLRPAPTDASPWLAAGVVARLARYTWPGNVRQLRNVCLHLAACSATPGPLRPDDPELLRLMPAVVERAPIERDVSSAPGAPEARAAVPPPAPRRPSAIGADEVYRVMVAVDFRLGAAAEWFGLSRPAMNALIDRHPRLRRAQRLEAPEITSALEVARVADKPAWLALEVSERGLVRRMKELGLAP